MTQYINNPLDKHYTESPGDYAQKGSLPDEEVLIRQLLASLKIAMVKCERLGFTHKLFKTKKYASHNKSAKRNEEKIVALLNESQMYRSAFLRIINDMPDSSGGREALTIL